VLLWSRREGFRGYFWGNLMPQFTGFAP